MVTGSTGERTTMSAPRRATKRPTANAKRQDAAPPKEAPPLTGKAVRHLRALGHHLDPVVQIGKDGITDGVVAATREALLAHELIKVKILQDAPVERTEAGAELARRAGASLAQTLGRTLLLYKRHPNKPKLVLPR